MDPTQLSAAEAGRAITDGGLSPVALTEAYLDRIVREVRVKHPRQYLDAVARGDPVAERREVTRDDAGFEFMLNALRLTEGVPSALFAERTGFPLAIVARPLEEGVRRGLLDADPARIAATGLGRQFLNRTTALFLPETSTRQRAAIEIAGPAS